MNYIIYLYIVYIYMASLLYYYKCNDGDLINGNLKDYVSNLYNTPVNNGTISTSILKFGTGSLNLSAIDPISYINIANKINCSPSGEYNGVYSMSMWFKTNNPNNLVNLFCISPNGSGFSIASTIRIKGSNKINEFTLNNEYNINEPLDYSAYNLKDNNWHNICWISFGNSTTKNIYIDNILWGTTSSYTTVAYTYDAVGTVSRIGSSAWSQDENLKGYVDDIQIYRGTLTANDVSIIYTGAVSCFNKGVKILCLNKNFDEEYILIENLKKGDIVKSYKHGYRKIDLINKKDLINNPKIFSKCMYIMKKTNENNLIDDLIITGGHSILVDSLKGYEIENTKKMGDIQKIDDKYLLLSSVYNDFIKLENENLYTYYNFILENNGDDNERYGVYANGLLTETPSKNYFIKFFGM